MVAQLIILFGPTYLNKVLKFGVAETGYLVTLPLIPYIFARIASGFASDMITCIGEKTKMILFNTVSIMGCAILLIVLGFMDSTMAVTAMILLVLVETSFGPSVGGFYKCAAIHTRQYNHFVLSCIQFTKCLALFVEPGLNLLIVSKDDRPAEWRIIFFLHSAVLVFSAIFFLVFVTDQPAKFAGENETDNLKKNDMEIKAMQNF